MTNGDLSMLRGRLIENEPLAKHTSWRVGGPADRMYIPFDREDLIGFIRQLPPEEPVFWIGLGSNLLVRDGGIRGTVINTKGRLKEMKRLTDDSVYVEAGVPCAHVARFCGDLGLCGAEFMAGIPGTMGGALRMNAGAFGGETWAIVQSVEILSADGFVSERGKETFQIGYRSVKGFEVGKEWFISAVLRLPVGDTESSQQKIRELLDRRGKTQPTNQPSCGSVFKNPPGDHAARLIEAAGLKGYTIGGASVSEKHANFIVNLGQAKAADIEALIGHVRQTVENTYGISLQTEVCMVGETSEALSG